MNKTTLTALLKDFKPDEIEVFIAYCEKLRTAKKKTGASWVIANPWMERLSDEKLALMFKNVAKDGLVFDGIHITLQSTGVSYDYIAYKNKMFNVHPESKIDVSLVYDGDSFEFAKKDGKVFYTHTISSPFQRKEMIGGYCIIRNKRGEFITILDRSDIDKHRKVAKTDLIWKQWFTEMATKTVIKKACKLHFSDLYQNIETLDNDNYEIENPLDLDLKIKGEIDAIETIEELQKYYHKNKGKGKAFDKYVSLKKKELTPAEPAKNCPKCDAPGGAIHDKECPNFKQPTK